MPASDSVYINIIADAAKSVAGIAKLGAAFYAANKIFKTALRIGSDLIEAYKGQEQAEAKLSAALRATGRQYEISLRSLADYASELQNVTTYGDEATIAAMAMLQQLGDLDEQGLRKLTPLVQDFATAMGVDLQTAASLVGKTLGSTTNALSRYGVSIDATAPKEEKLAALISVLDKKFGGFSRQVALTGTGALQQLNNIMSDVKEEGGAALLDALKPLIVNMTGFLTRTLQAWSAQRNLNMALKGEATSIYEVDKAIKTNNDRRQKLLDLQKQLQIYNSKQIPLDKGIIGRADELGIVLGETTRLRQNAMAATAAGIRQTQENADTLAAEREEIQKSTEIQAVRINLLKQEQEAAEKAATAAEKQNTRIMETWGKNPKVFLDPIAKMAAHQKAVKAATEDATAAIEKQQKALIYLNDIVGPFAAALGEAMVKSSDAWEILKEAAKDAIATILEMLAKQEFVKAAAAFPNFAAMAAHAAAGVLAMVAAGAVRAMAEGGIVTQPTQALIGEAGPEAVIPLNRAGGMMGNRVVVHVYGSVMEEEGLARKIGAIVGRQRRGY